MIYTEQQRRIQGAVANSTLTFGRTLMPNSFPLSPCQMHIDWDKALEDPSILRLNIEAPRKHAKTTVIARTYPLKTLLTSIAMGKREYILLIGKTQKSVAAKSLHHLKFNLTYNQRIRDVYGDWSKATAETWGAFEIILADGSVVASLGLNQPISGLNVRDLRPTMILLDDVQDIHNTKTADMMRQHLRWLLGEVLPALEDDGKAINIATPKHELALVRELKKAYGWTTLGDREGGGYDAIVSDEKKLSLWPVKISYKELKEIEKSASSMNELRLFYSEYRCQLVGSEEQLFRPEYFRYYRGNLTYDSVGNQFLKITHLWRESDNKRFSEDPGIFELTEPEMRPVATFTGCDPASSQKEGSSYATIVTIAVDVEKNMFVLPYFRKRVSPSALYAEVMKRNIEYKPSFTTIEANGYQVSLADQVRNSDDGMFIAGLRKKHITRDSKDTRHERMEPFFYQGKVFFTEQMNELKTDLLLYPRGKRDTLDGLEFATTRIHGPMHISTVKPMTLYKERMGIEDNSDRWLAVV